MKSYYWWPYKWVNMGGKPKISPMLNAIIDDDLSALKQMRSEGMTLSDSDTGTLQRVLFEKMDSVNLMKLLIEEEYITSFLSADSHFKDAKYVSGKCIGQDGYFWSLLAKACYDQQYEIMDLFARYRFNYTNYCINGKEYWVEDLIFQRDDLRAFKILYENGEIIGDTDIIDGLGDYRLYKKQRERYPKGRITEYINEHPYPVRRSMGMDEWAFRQIDSPSYFKVGLFNRKKMSRNNEILRLNYEDRIRAQKEYIAWLQKAGKWKRWQKYLAEDEAIDKSFFEDALPILLKG